MTLRNKTLLVLSLTLVSAIAILSLVAQLVLLRGFIGAERLDTERDVERALDILAYDRSTLEGITRDWSEGDDTYAFIQDANDGYIQSNLSDDSTYVNNRLNVIAYVNSAGQIVFARAYNAVERKQQPLPESLKQRLTDEQTGKLLLPRPVPEGGLTGWLLTPEGPLLISAQPILPSNRQGPARGTLIFGRYLDAAAVERLTETSHLALALRPFDDPQLPPDFQAIHATADQALILVQVLDEATIAGYATLDDIYGKPALLLRVSNPRVIYAQGQTTLRYFLGWLLLLVLLLGLGGIALAGRLERSYTDIAALRQTQEALRRRDAILEAVRFAAEQFLKTSDWEQNIQEILARLGTAGQTSRVYIFENHTSPAGTLLTSQRYEWVAPGITPQMGNPELQNLPLVAAGFGRWIPLLNTGQLIYGHVRDFPASERTVLAAQDIRSILIAPIFVENVLWGFIGLDDCLVERKWSVAEISALEAAANTLGTAIARKRVDQELRARAAELEAVRQASLGLTSSLDLSAVLDAILRSTLQFAHGAKDAHIYLYRPGSPGENARLTFGAALWADGRKGQPWAEPRPEGLTYTVARQGETIIVPDMRAHPLYAHAPPTWSGAIIGLPLKAGTRVLGVMNVAYTEPRAFAESELRALHLLADQAAIAIANAQLHQALQTSEIRHRTLVENLPIGVCRVTPGPRGKYLMANTAYLRMFGFESEQALKQVAPADLYVDPDDRRVFSERMLAQGSVTDLELRLKRMDGTPLWGLLSAQVGYQNGKAVYFDCTIQDVTARKQAEAALRDKVAALQTLGKIQQDITSTQSLSERLERLLEHLAAQMRADISVVFLLDPATGELRAIAQRGARKPDFPQPLRLKIGEGAGGWVAQHGIPLAISDVAQDPRWVRVEVSNSEGIVSYLGVPLRVEGRVIGVLDVATRTPRVFTVEEIEFLTTLAGQAAIAIQNARLFEETKRRADQLAILNRIASAANRALTQDELLEEIQREITAALAPDAFFIALYDAASDELDFCLRTDAGERMPPERRPLRVAAFTARVVATHQPLLIRDWEQEKDQYPPPELFGTMKSPRTWLGVPMLLGEQVIGVISVQAYRPNAYGKEEEQLLGTIADQVAVAIAKARIFDAERLARERTEALREATQAISGSLEFNEVLRVLLQQLKRVLTYDTASVLLLGEADQPALVAGIGYADERMTSQAAGDLLKTSPILRQMAQDLQPITIADVREHPGWIWVPGAEPVRSFLATPIVAQARMIGALMVDNRQTHFFTEADVRTAQALAQHIAIAIHNARLYDETRRNADQLARINQISAAINQPFALDDVLGSTLRELIRALEVDRGGIALLAEARDHLTVISEHSPGGGPPALGQTIPVRDNPSMEFVLRERRALAVTDVEHDPRLGRAAADLLRAVGTRSILIVPLLVRGEVIGTIGLDSQRSERVFGDAEIKFAQTIANQAAIAIEKARLFEAEQTRRAELDALNRIATAVNQSLDLDAILNAALEELTHALGVRGGWVSLLDADKGELILRAERGGTPAIHMGGDHVHMGTGFNGRVAQEGTPRTINLEESDVAPRAALLAAGYRSIAATPLFSAGTVAGVLGLAADTRDRFGEAELRLLSAVSNTLSLALNNARLFASVEKQVRQLAALREIDHTLSSMLELAPMLETMLSNIVEIVPCDSAAVLLLDGVTLRAVAARGREQAALARFTLDISDNAIFQEMARTQAPAIIGDTREYPNWVTVPGVEFARAWLAAPLIARGAMIGQIGLFSATPHAFTREHGDLLRAFANHAAIAIANARLRAELHEQARCDSLTQVLNHGTFIAELRAAGDAVLAQGGSLALIMLDLDNFKQYNDTYGHVVGDQVLRLTVQAIRAHIKQTDFVGRWGGEEFAIALRGTDVERAQRVAARIRTTLAATALLDRHAQQIPPPTASQGIATLPQIGRDVDDLIEQADRALYRAKSRGKDQVAVAERVARDASDSSTNPYSTPNSSNRSSSIPK
jgi:diguanylate cyclase (GGDEF)-like protein/PAS domain S-box-containing protein